MSSDCSEVRDVLSSLAIKVRSCKEDPRAQEVGNALYSLQGMSSDCSEVRDVLSSLAIKVRSCKEDLDAQHLGNALYGLHGVAWIGSTPDFLSVLSFLNQQVNKIVNHFSLKESVDSRIITKELITLCQSLTFLLPEVSELLNVKDHTDLERLISLIKEELACRKRNGDRFYKSTEFQLKSKKRMHKIAMKISQDIPIEVHNNVHLFDLFESDITLHTPINGNHINEMTNIEVDGIHHRNGKKLLFCKGKDKYLKSKGVFVFRMVVFQMDKMKDIEIEEWILKTISSLGSNVFK
jgi:hypothetical protein